jgi:hypothetical protein
MSDRSWYQDSPKRFYTQDYLQRVESFINFVLSKPKNISAGEIRCPFMKCNNKKSHYKNVVMMHLLKKGFIEKYLFWYAHGEPYVPHETML